VTPRQCRPVEPAADSGLSAHDRKAAVAHFIPCLSLPAVGERRGLRRSATARRSCIHRSPTRATIVATPAPGRRDCP